MESLYTSSGRHVNDREGLFSIRAISLLLLVVCFAAAFRLGVFHEVYSSHPERIDSPDTVRYEAPALNMLATGSMRDGLSVSETQDVHVAPAYPWFIYAVYRVFGQDHKNLVHAQIGLSLLNILLLYMFTAAVWNRKAALMSAALFAFAPLQSLYAAILLSETLFVFSVLILCNVAVRFLQRYSVSPSLWLALVLGLAIGFSALVRPISYYLVFVFIVALLVFHFALKGVQFSRFVKSAACILVGFAIVVGPWQVRNKSIADAYLFTDNPGQIMLYWKAAGLIAYRDSVPPETVRAQLKATVPANFLSIAEKHAYEQQAGLDIIKSDIPGYIRFSLHGLKTMVVGPGLKKFGNFFDGDNAGRSNGTADPGSLGFLEEKTGYEIWYLLIIAYSVFYLLCIYSLFLIGSMKYWRRGENRIVLIFCIALAGYFILASTGHSAADSRMRIPAMPMLVLFAGIGLSALSKPKWRSKKVEKAQ